MSDNLRTLLHQDKWLLARQAYELGTLVIDWGREDARGWAEKQGWPTPSLGFKQAFIKKMLENAENFDKAIFECGVDVFIRSE